MIETDPDFHESSVMFNGGGEISQQQQLVTSIQNVMPTLRTQPCVKIVEQPASKALRFRYECEGRSAGSIPGASSTPENKTFPEIQICGYKGRAVVVVSCVTKDEPYRLVRSLKLHFCWPLSILVDLPLYLRLLHHWKQTLWLLRSKISSWFFKSAQYWTCFWIFSFILSIIRWALG